MLVLLAPFQHYLPQIITLKMRWRNANLLQAYNIKANKSLKFGVMLKIEKLASACA